MIELDLTQGTKEWLETRLVNFTASEAPMMMNASKYFSRAQLLDHKKGWITEISAFTQELFNKGHKAEAMARPIAAKVAKADFYPVVGLLENTKYLASFDGITMMEDVLFEHKIYNKTLAENVLNNVLGPDYYYQLEHQLMVSGAGKCLFVCSDGTEEKFYSMWYESIPERRAELIAGWEQFAIDLENHEPQAKTEKVIAEAPKDLPLISYKMDGLSLTSNLDAYKSAANDLVEKSNQVIETDQDFANAEARQKVFTKAEKDITALCDRVLSEVADIDAFTKNLKYIGAQIREARLAEGKQIKGRKEEIRSTIMTESKHAINSAVGDAEKRIKCRLPALTCDVLQAMKGKKTVDSLKDAAESEVAKGKIEITNYLSTALSNMETIRELAPEHKHLFNDWPSIAFKANDDFTALVKTRLFEDQERVNAERKRMEAEAKEKAEREAKAKLEAERAKIQLEEETKAQAKVDEEKRVALEEANQIARDEQTKAAADNIVNSIADDIGAETAADIKANDKAEAARLEQIKAEGAYESKLADQRLEQRSGASHTATVVTTQKVEQMQAPANEPVKTFKRLPTEIEAAFMAGFMVRHNQVDTPVNPKKEAAIMATKYSNDKEAA